MTLNYTIMHINFRFFRETLVASRFAQVFHIIDDALVRHSIVVLIQAYQWSRAS